MNRVKVNNVELYYQSVGNESETILFSHGYLMNNTMFNGQIDVFKDRFCCISFDHRGHGQSEVTKDGYELDNLVTDAISLIEALNNDGGWWAVIGKVMAILFHTSFLKDDSRQAEVKKWRDIITGHSKKGLFPFGKGIFARDSVLEKLAGLSLPVAVIVGEEDIATTPEYAQRMADVIPNAKLYKIPDAGHSAAIEKPIEVADAMRDFYTSAGII